MLSADRLSVLRERNKDLLKQLRQQRERLQHFSCTQSRTGGEAEAEAREDGEIETLTDRNLETLTDRNLETLTDRNLETLTDRNLETLTDRNLETLTDRNLETLTDRNLETLADRNLETLTDRNLETLTDRNLETLTDRNLETLADRNLETLTDRNLETLMDRNPVEMETLTDRNPVEMETLTDRNLETLTDRNPVGMETLTDRNPVEMETLTDRNPVGMETLTDVQMETLTDRNPVEMETLTDVQMETLTDRNPVEMEILTDGPARAASNKPTVSFAASETFETQSEVQPRGGDAPTRLTTTHRRGTADPTVSSEPVEGGSRSPVARNRPPQDARKPGSRATRLLGRGKQLREVGSGVTFHSNEREEMSASDRHHLQPLLGYDWIAGILDVESSLIERSEEFFNDLRIFRSVNKDECVHRQQAGFSEGNHSVPPLLADEDGPEADVDTHQCTFSYRINSRLFPVPLHSQECCPVCRKPKSAHPHTAAEPALIRVSIPRSTLLPAYEHKAHRRCSFDPSDSLGLPSHCLSGWWNTGQSSLPQPSSLDLQSSLTTQTSTRLISAQSQSKEQLDRSVSRASGDRRSDRILNVSRLARHHFQHLSPRKQPCSSSYPVY